MPTNQTSTSDNSPQGINRRHRVLRLACLPVFIALFMFLPAGTWAWPNGWAFGLVLLVGIPAIFLVLHRVNPEAIVARSSFHKGTKGWDKVLLRMDERNVKWGGTGSEIVPVVAPTVRSGRLGDFQGDFRPAPFSHPVVHQQLADLNFHAPSEYFSPAAAMAGRRCLLLDVNKSIGQISKKVTAVRMFASNRSRQSSFSV